MYFRVECINGSLKQSPLTELAASSSTSYEGSTRTGGTPSGAVLKFHSDMTHGMELTSLTETEERGNQVFLIVF